MFFAAGANSHRGKYVQYAYGTIALANVAFNAIFRRSKKTNFLGFRSCGSPIITIVVVVVVLVVVVVVVVEVIVLVRSRF